MPERDQARRFEELVLPHLGAAHNYARWLVRNAAAAEDIVQESCLRAFKGLHRFAGGNARAWLLTIVRHESYDWLKSDPGRKLVPLEAEELSPADAAALGHVDTPEAALLRLEDGQRLERALLELPEGYREVLILRELEDMNYKDIAQVLDAPLGTVMSRLARARAALRKQLAGAP